MKELSFELGIPEVIDKVRALSVEKLVHWVEAFIKQSHPVEFF